VPLLLRRARRARGLTDAFAIASDKDRRKLRNEIAHGPKDLEARAADPAASTLDVQLLLQVTGSPVYGTWKAAWTKAWRNQGAKWSTAQWPDTLAADAFATLLLPVPAGRVGLAIGKHPRVLATPIFTSGPAPEQGSYSDLALGLIAQWITNPADGHSARLALPVLEVIARAGVLERRVEDFGHEWPLPAPDGV
jgi:hypothetical protein